jgi:hypothetical protein
MALRHWTGRRIGGLWLAGTVLFIVELAWLRHYNRLAEERFAAQHDLRHEGTKWVPKVAAPRAVSDSLEATTFVLLRQRAQRHGGQPLTARDSAVERFSREWRTLSTPARDSLWRLLAIPQRLSLLQRDSLRDLLGSEVGAAADQVAAAWPLILATGALMALVVCAVPLSLVIVTGLWLVARRRSQGMIEETAA